MAVPDWKGLFDFSMRYQDGTGPAKEMKSEDRAWFEEAVQHYTMDVVKRMTDIKQVLDKTSGEETEESVAQKEKVLEELVEIVENIDYARDLTKIGGLEMLLSLLESPHPSLRSGAAEVAATCAQINPPVQAWFMQGGALPKLLKLLDDSDQTCRQKGLLAISCLVRNHSPGLSAFVALGGVGKLVAVLEGDSPRVQRKALQLLTHTAQEVPHALPTARVLAAAGAALGSRDREVQGAALGLLLQLSRNRETHAALQTDAALEERLMRLQRELEVCGPGESGEANNDEQMKVADVLESLKGSARTAPNPAGGSEQTAPPTSPLKLLGPPASS